MTEQHSSFLTVFFSLLIQFQFLMSIKKFYNFLLWEPKENAIIYNHKILFTHSLAQQKHFIHRWLHALYTLSHQKARGKR